MRIKNSNDLSHSDTESKYSYSTGHFKSDPSKFTEITGQQDKIFLLTLFSFHIDNVLPPSQILEQQQQIQILVGQSNFKPADFFLKIEDAAAKPVSIKKCLMGLTEAYKNELEKQTSEIYEKTVIKKLPTYLKKVVQSYPAKRQEVVNLLI